MPYRHFLGEVGGGGVYIIYRVYGVCRGIPGYIGYWVWKHELVLRDTHCSGAWGFIYRYI
jgi:hypothetical protein